MKNGFRADWKWQLDYLDPIRRIVGPHLLEPAPIEVDMREATDLMLLIARDLRIGCRVRRPGYAERYPWDFTLRAHRDTGAKTELQKIVEGWGHWLFYGHAWPDSPPAIGRWFLIDLNAWRAHMIRHQDLVRPVMRNNGDGTRLAAFDLRKFPPDPKILVAASDELPDAPPPFSRSPTNGGAGPQLSLFGGHREVEP